MKNLILAAALGPKGLEALEPLLKTDALASFIVPKAVICFLRGSRDGQISLPSFDVLNKAGGLYKGQVSVNGTYYEFSDASETEVAAIVSVSTNNPIESDIKSLDLAKLSKTVELLVKAQQKVEVKEPPDGVAEQKEPQKAIPPMGPSNNRVKQSVIKSAMIPDRKLGKKCKACRKENFNDKKFVGCTCLKSLAKSVTSQSTPLGVILGFSKLDADAIYTILETINE